jgi:PAS domain S-box-containing protein
MFLTVLSYFISHGTGFVEAPLARAFMSLSAVGVTTFLALRYQSAVQALRAQATLLDLTHDTVFVRDMNDVITYWNRGAEEQYGWKREEAVGRVISELLQTHFPEPPEKILAGLLRTGRWDGELVHTRRDGSRAVVSSRWALKRDERGRPKTILETNNDVTAEKHALEALVEAQAQLAHVTRVTTLGEMSASIAHEVNQPLAGIITNGEAGLRWLERDVPQLEEVRGAMERMIRDGKRAGQVVQRLRALARKAPMQTAPLDMNEVADEAVGLVRSEVLAHRITPRLELAPDLPPMLGDRVELQQVVINLMINGMQAMESVIDRPRDLVIRSAKNEADEALISVEDSGSGIDPHSMNRLFTPFFTTRPAGMGMGLSICRSLIEANGGRIWASNNAGPGTIFQFSLPLKAKGVL